MGREVKEEIRTFYQNASKHNNIDNLIAEIFTRSIGKYILSSNEISQLEVEELTEDTFQYEEWQLNIIHEARDYYPDREWAEVKTAFLQRGLELVRDTTQEP